MSDFSAAWLALREPADHRARNGALLATLARAFAGKREIAVVDLGCGTGSNLRVCAPHLPPRQRWQLVDRDSVLLTAARNQLSAWADTCTSADGNLHLTHGNRAISVSFVCADLAADLEAVLGAESGLVTAAALFDLASADWIERLADAVVRQRAAFYAALTYNGAEHWTPPHPADAAVTNAFQAHLRRDKGFGSAAGLQANHVLARAFTRSGYEVHAADSPWRLGPADRALIHELARGIADAVRQTGQVEENEIEAWLEARLNGSTCTIGHTDVLALPPP